eukprot:15468860-Alexandrium_andersonii.AAC.1
MTEVCRTPPASLQGAHTKSTCDLLCPTLNVCRSAATPYQVFTGQSSNRSRQCINASPLGSLRAAQTGPTQGEEEWESMALKSPQSRRWEEAGAQLQAWRTWPQKEARAASGASSSGA